MALDPAIMQAVEQLDYRVTAGDVAAKAGLDVNTAQRGLLALAADAGGHLQVAETGDMAFLFPQDFRAILRNKYLRLRLQEIWQRVWGVLFYLIRISFGILLLLAIALMVVAIIAILVAMQSASQRDSQGNNNRSSGGGMFYFPRFWISPSWFYIFDPNPYHAAGSRRRPATASEPTSSMNFLEAIFSFLFGDGNPNADREERRWQQIATVIRNHRGAVAAEQIAPYLEIDLATQVDEDYMLPVLSRFEGQPQVSPEGGIIYFFPELQVTAREQQRQVVPAYLHEFHWRFSRASSSQKILAVGLGATLLVLALVFWNLQQQIDVSTLSLVAFVNSIFWVMVGYGIGFLTIPLVRYFWLQWRNRKIDTRNQLRQDNAQLLSEAGPELQEKLAFARQFATETVVRQEDLVYTTEKDLLEQESDRLDEIDAEWQRRLNQSRSEGDR